MKKVFFTLFILAVPLFASAAGIIYFDRSANLYYMPVVAKYRGTSKDNLSAISSKTYAGIRTLNIYVYDPQSRESRYLFDSDFNDSIIDILYESAYNNTQQSIDYNNNGNVRNNEGIAQRAPKSSLLIITQNESTATSTVWRIMKRGSGKTMIHQFGKNTEWFFDTGNDKLLFFTKVDSDITVVEKQW